MGKLNLLVSVPHAGLEVPEEVASYCILTPRQIVEDGDEGAADIYSLEEEVQAFVTTRIARAIVDLNRPEHDRSKDGVVKTHTCWNVPVYSPFPPENVVEALLDRFYRPYHAELTESARSDTRLGIDCHTMVASGPPVAPDPGAERPWICLRSMECSFARRLATGEATIRPPARGEGVSEVSKVRPVASDGR